MKRIVLAALLCALTLVGCGGHSPPATPHPQPTTKLIPPGAIKVPPCLSTAPPCSALTPEGAKGANVSHYLNGPPPLTLVGPGIRIDSTGLRLIEGFENVYEARYCPFWDPYGHVWTRAFGETDWSGDFGGVCISHSQAETNVRYLVEADYQYAVRGLDLNLSQQQVDALDDFVWNLGAGIFTGTFRSQIERREWSAILGYDIAGGVVLSGLRARRETEYRLLVANPPKPPVLTRKQLEARLRELDKLLGARTKADPVGHNCARPPYKHAYPSARYDNACATWAKEARETAKKLGKR
jgi:GH24 family phage-related lysozyme (muramidase)